MDAQEAARVPARRAGLPTEAGGVGGVVDGQILHVEDLVAVHVGDRHLRGGNQVQVIALDGVHLPLLVGQLPGAAG